MRHTNGFLAAVILCAVLVGTAHADDNLIVNGDFSSGTSGWTTNNGSFSIIQSDGNPAPSGQLVAAANSTAGITSDCIVISPQRIDLYAEAKTQTDQVNASISVTKYSDNACTTVLGTGATIGKYLEAGTWDTLVYTNTRLSADVGSVRVSLQVNQMGRSAATVVFDNIYFGHSRTAPVQLQTFHVD